MNNSIKIAAKKYICIEVTLRCTYDDEVGIYIMAQKYLLVLVVVVVVGKTMGLTIQPSIDL